LPAAPGGPGSGSGAGTAAGAAAAMRFPRAAAWASAGRLLSRSAQAQPLGLLRPRLLLAAACQRLAQRSMGHTLAGTFRRINTSRSDRAKWSHNVAFNEHGAQPYTGYSKHSPSKSAGEPLSLS